MAQRRIEQIDPAQAEVMQGAQDGDLVETSQAVEEPTAEELAAFEAQVVDLARAVFGSDEEGEDDAAAVEAGARGGALEHAWCVFSSHADSVFCVATHPTDASLVVSGDGADGAESAWLWRTAAGGGGGAAAGGGGGAARGEAVAQLLGHSDSVVAVAFSSTGKYVASGGMDSVVRVAKVSRLVALQEELDGDGDAKHLVVRGGDKAAKVTELQGPAGEVEWIDWHPKGNVLLVGSADATTWMFNAASGDVMAVFAGHADAVLCGCFTSNGKWVCTGSADGTVYVFDPKTSQPRHHFQGDLFHQGPVTTLVSHPDPEVPQLLSCGQDAAVKLLQANTGRILAHLNGHEAGVEAAAFCRSNPLLAATGGCDNTIIVWNLRGDGTERTRFQHEDTVTQLVWAEREPLLFSSSLDGTVRQWDARNGQELKRWLGHTDAILGLALTCDGQSLVTCSDDRTCRVFAVAGGATPEEVEQELARVESSEGADQEEETQTAE